MKPTSKRGNGGFLLSLLVLCVMLPSVAANLQVIPSSAQVNKTVGAPSNLTLQIRNTALYDYYNISFEDNTYISFPRVPQLSAGQSINVTASIIAEQSIGRELRIRGYYQAQVGQTQRTHLVEIVPFESSPCDFTITEGDTIQWHSGVLNDIILVDASTALPLDGSTIKHNQSFSKTFSAPASFSYYVSLSGFPFPQTCTITALDDSGYVNDPQKDAKFVLNVTVQYPPTTISVTAPIVNYSLQFYEAQDGVVTITNTGTQTAKAVHLGGEWLAFSKNNFDLNPGQTVAATYTITPLITRTNQTNQTYTKQLTVAGNFNTISIPLTVFIAHATIGENATDIGDLKDFLGDFCLKYPRSQFCDPEPQVVYSGVNGTGNQEFNVTMTTEQWRNQQMAQLEQIEIQKTDSNYNKEQTAAMRQEINGTNTRLESLEDKVNFLIEDKEESTDSAIMTIGLMGGFLLIASIGGLIYIYKNKNEANQVTRWT